MWQSLKGTRFKSACVSAEFGDFPRVMSSTADSQAVTRGAMPAAGVSRGHRLPVSPALGLQVFPAACIPMPKISAWKTHISLLLVFLFC